MFTNTVLSENPRVVDYSVRGISKMNAAPLTESRRKAAIEQIVNSEYRRERAYGREIVLLSPALLTLLADRGKISSLSGDANLELKADLAMAFRPYSPAERRIIFKVLVQGQSVEKATRRMRKHSSRGGCS